MKKSVAHLALVSFCFLVVVDCMAQASIQWVDFPPSQSRLTFDPPGLNGVPTKSQEGLQIGGGASNVRRFAYIFSRASDAGSFATIVVFSVKADQTFFTSEPQFDAVISTLYTEFQNKPINWTDGEKLKANSPIGEVKYRRFGALGRSCVSFGGLYGFSSTIGSSTGWAASGTEQLVGYYCAQLGHTLSPADVGLVISRIGYSDLGKPNEPRPQSFATSVPGPSERSDTLKPKRPVAILWEGRPSQISATVSAETSQSQLRLEVLIPSEALVCTGLATGVNSDSGSWVLQCSNNVSASGTIRSVGRGQGSVGEGTDNKGAKISFIVAGQ